MILDLKRIWHAAGYSLTAATAMLNASDNGTSPYETESYVSTREQVGWQKVKWPDIYVTGEFLYWQAAEDGLDYVVDSQAPMRISQQGPVIRFALPDGKVKEVSFDYDPGFRVGLGTIFGNLWDLNLSWTRFRTDDTSSTRKSATGTLLPTKLTVFDTPGLFPPSALYFADRASAHWDIDYDTLTLEFGRAFTPNKYLALRPHIGVIGAWIDQSMSFNYDSTSILGSVLLMKVKNNNDFKGVGLRTGFDLRCPLGKGWSIFGNFAGALLWGDFSLKQRQDLDDLVFQLTIDMLHLHHGQRDVVGNLQMLGGFRWDRYFSKKRTHLGLYAAYEFNEWFRQYRIVSFNQPVMNGTIDNLSGNRGDLEFQGFTLGARFDF